MSASDPATALISLPQNAINSWVAGTPAAELPVTAARANANGARNGGVSAARLKSGKRGPIYGLVHESCLSQPQPFGPRIP